MLVPASKQAQTNTAGAALKDRNATGPRQDGGAGGELPPSTVGMVPIGGIVMYSGAFADIPDNWHLCDGTGGTPNLTDRFILGTNTEGELAATGGTKTHKHNLIAADTPAGTATVVAITAGTPAGTISNVSAGTPAGTVDAGGAHTHGFTSSANAATPDLLAPDTTGTGVAAQGTTDSDGSHTHTFSGTALGAHGHTFSGTALGTHTHLLAGKTALGETAGGGYGTNDILPPFFKLAFIQRIE